MRRPLGPQFDSVQFHMGSVLIEFKFWERVRWQWLRFRFHVRELDNQGMHYRRKTFR